MAIFGDWHAKLYFPGFIALAIAAWVLLTVRDTPQSQGLPPIEAFKNDYPTSFRYEQSHEQEFTTRQIFLDHVLNNRLLWVIAVINAFVYSTSAA